MNEAPSYYVCPSTDGQTISTTLDNDPQVSIIEESVPDEHPSDVSLVIKWWKDGEIVDDYIAAYIDKCKNLVRYLVFHMTEAGLGDKFEVTEGIHKESGRPIHILRILGTFEPEIWTHRITDAYRLALFDECIIEGSDVKTCVTFLKRVLSDKLYDAKNAELTAMFEYTVAAFEDAKTMELLMGIVAQKLLKYKDNMFEAVRNKVEKDVDVNYVTLGQDVVQFDVPDSLQKYYTAYVSEAQFHILMSSIQEYKLHADDAVKLDIQQLNKVYALIKKVPKGAEYDQKFMDTIREFYLDKENDQNIAIRHGAFINMMRFYKFKPNIMEKLLFERFHKVSMPWLDVHKKYFKLALPKNSEYTRSITKICSALDNYHERIEVELAKAKKHEEESKKASASIKDAASSEMLKNVDGLLDKLKNTTL